MGQRHSGLSKSTAGGENVRINYAVSSMRGSRPRMEDAGIPYSEGSTACLALIREYQIIVGNVGDSRCVLSRHGQAMDLSTDHKPNLPNEQQRIKDAGGEVIIRGGCHRVDKNLAMSRSMGDFQFKSNPDLPDIEQKVTCNLDVCTMGITHDTYFLLIASDGIWAVLSSQEAVRFVKQKLDNGTTDLGVICENLLTRCVESKDNATVILVQFKHAGRLPHPLPASAVAPEVHQAGAAGNSSVADPEASAEAKADTESEIKEYTAEDALLPLSTMPAEL